MDNKLLFYTEGMRKRLENISHSISGNYNSHLVFSDDTCTNGKVMQINPYYITNYSEETIIKTCKFFDIPIEDDMYSATWWDDNASTVHESAHDLLSNFNIFSNIEYDMYMETEYGKKIIKDILNIIEDAFIEKAICILFKGTRKYILFSNAMAFNSRKSILELAKDTSKVDIFLEWATQYCILGQVKGTVKDKDVLEVISKTQSLFDAGKISLKSEVRYEFAKRIYSIVKDFIYDASKENEYNSYSNSPDLNSKDKKSFDEKNGDPVSQKLSQNKDFMSFQFAKDAENQSGQENAVLDENFQANNFSQEELNGIKDEIYIEQQNVFLEKEKYFIETEKTRKEELNSDKIKQELASIEKSELNKNIEIKANFPCMKSSTQYAVDYAKTLSKVSGIISNFVRLFKNLEEKNDDYERGLEIGTSLDSTKFGRKDRRFWKEEVESKKPVDLSIVILVDGSGSTHDINEKLKETCITVYEVAKQLNIPIAIVEERAIYKKPIVEQNIKVDFNSSIAMKYNISSITSKGGTREGVSLLWTYEYQKKTCPNATKRLFIVLSDGEPQHDGYPRPFNIKDSKASADKISRDKNCQLVAISLKDKAYIPLKNIYNQVISCSDNLDRLPFELVKLIRKALNK